MSIFDRLSKNNLQLQPDKCEFLRKEVMCLGHNITESGAKPDLNKIIDVSNFPTPKIPNYIKSFLGLAGYYRLLLEISVNSLNH